MGSTGQYWSSKGQYWSSKGQQGAARGSIGAARGSKGQHLDAARVFEACGDGDRILPDHECPLGEEVVFIGIRSL